MYFNDFRPWYCNILTGRVASGRYNGLTLRGFRVRSADRFNWINLDLYCGYLGIFSCLLLRYPRYLRYRVCVFLVWDYQWKKKSIKRKTFPIKLTPLQSYMHCNFNNMQIDWTLICTKTVDVKASVLLFLLITILRIIWHLRTVWWRDVKRTWQIYSSQQYKYTYTYS